MERTRTRVVTTLLAAASTAGLLAGCGAGSSARGAAGQRVGPAVNPSIAPTHAQRALPADKDIVEVPALRKTITLTTCAAADGGWASSGTAANPGTTARTYHILVFFTDRYARTIDYARTAVTVPAGQRAPWTAATRFAATSGTGCVLRGLWQS